MLLEIAIDKKNFVSSVLNCISFQTLMNILSEFFCVFFSKTLPHLNQPKEVNHKAHKNLVRWNWHQCFNYLVTDDHPHAMKRIPILNLDFYLSVEKKFWHVSH